MLTSRTNTMKRRKTYDRRFMRGIQVVTSFRNKSRVLTAHQSRIDSAAPSVMLSPRSSVVRHLDPQKSNYPNTLHSIYI